MAVAKGGVGVDDGPVLVLEAGGELVAENCVEVVELEIPVGEGVT